MQSNDHYYAPELIVVWIPQRHHNTASLTYKIIAPEFNANEPTSGN
jgi:hypothetical protein